MGQDLHVTLVQTKICWYQLDENLKHLECLLEKVEHTDLVVLPEMFATGFVLNDLEKLSGGDRVLSWMNCWAQEHGAAVAGSVALQNEAGRWVNRLLLVEPDGAVQYYDKRHLFVKSPEPELFTQGERQEVFEYKGWRICPQVCYDLRFPVWSRNAYAQGAFRYDVLLYVANWPAARAEHWNTLLKARAIENQAYVVAVNCVGEDPNGSRYTGDTQVVGPKGEVIAQCQPGKEQCVEVVLSQPSLSAYRNRFPVWQDWD